MNETSKEIKRLDMYNWHPLTKYIRQVYGDYWTNINEDFRTGYISEKVYEYHCKKTNFEFWLDYNIRFSLRHNKDYSLATIFKPLLINQYKDLCLFKYDNHLDFTELGYSFQDFFYLYNGLYQECRSVVFDLGTMEIVLAPQAKFKNLGEEDKGPWSYNSIYCEINKNSNNYFITEKMDGSNQNFCYNSTHQEIYGSGSQALEANIDDSWRLNEGWRLFKSNIGYERLLKEFPDTTFMFEYVSPKNPIVVKYTQEQEGLYLFAARDNLTGKEMNPVLLFYYADKYHVPHVNLYLEEDFDSILKKTKDYTCSEKEGWVVTIFNENYNSNVFKFKVKVDDYILMHKAVTGLISPNTIIEYMAEGKIDDFYSKFPDSHRERVFDIIEEVGEYEKNMYCQTLLEYSKCMDYVNNFLVEHNYTRVSEPEDNTKRQVMKIKFMEAAEKFCKKETKGYCKAMFLNHFKFQNPPRAISMLHNGKDLEKGRSYKKIKEIKEWNRKHQQETEAWYNEFIQSKEG